MLGIRTRGYKYIVASPVDHDRVVAWKVACNREKKIQPLPESAESAFFGAIERYFSSFRIVSVPAPSFHSYDFYPIWEVAKRVSGEFGMELLKAFPENSGKTKMGVFSGISKTVQKAHVPSGKFVLIIDDLLTTGHTFRVSCQAVINEGSFPACLSIA